MSFIIIYFIFTRISTNIRNICFYISIFILKINKSTIYSFLYILIQLSFNKYMLH
ncbi:hypothetical protein BCR36DRAFT_189092 [Piromyces finnis]|uniref:Uncharacterized protein n=1 Tax=Piromyces finnis TaxID=1754191 RepID=A0A1Y1UTF9_9FUNG|nr:hypothetical protein BCR36DRAFT_189092 [Piromyces finnis]|eukprot:ORX41319.1 hypothetical protein BCR36DRAFT_189092 [Piromyces finnis]